MMNDYTILVNLRAERHLSERRLRQAMLAQEAQRGSQSEQAQPRRLRLHLRLPQFTGLRSRLHQRQQQTVQPCADTALNAR